LFEKNTGKSTLSQKKKSEEYEIDFIGKGSRKKTVKPASPLGVELRQKTPPDKKNTSVWEKQRKRKGEGKELSYLSLN